MRSLDDTHDPQLRSWVESANDPQSDFPIQNLPFGFVAGGRAVVAIGDRVLDLARAGIAAEFGQFPSLRHRISDLLRAGNRTPATEAALLPMRDAELVALAPGDYTDFYASIHHATRVGQLFRPDNPLLPNYKYVPIAYHGRSSSIVGSGTAIHRPSGQSKAPNAELPVFGPSKRLDYELEVGVVIGRGNTLGEPIPIERAEEHALGVCLVNDWSARDIQAWEYQPLGPFLSKNFATSISPWIVTMEALAPFRAPATNPDPLAYLHSDENQQSGGIDITLEVLLRSRKMSEPTRLSIGSFRDMYWTAAQMIAHHTSNGCNLRAGDLLASGTVSGPERESAGCLLELTEGGKKPITLWSGEQRTFLEDGDEVILRGWCERPGFRRIGLGECRGAIVAARL